MWTDGEEAEVGRRIHRLVAAAVTTEELGEPFDVVTETRSLFRNEPFGAGAAPVLRFRCSSAVTVYLKRCRPQGWSLVGTEMRLGAGVADLVWSNDDGLVVVDELKSGQPNPNGLRVVAQMMRLAAGGTKRWGARFAGVRLVPLGKPGATSFHLLGDSQLVEGPLPVGMVVRS